MLLRLMRMSTAFYRVSFIGAALSEGLLEMLHGSPLEFEDIAKRLAPNLEMHDELRAWLAFGVAAGVLSLNRRKYELRGIAKKLANPTNDASAAMVEELAHIDHALIVNTPAMIRERRCFAMSEGDTWIVARSSRILEPFLFDAVDEVVPIFGAMRVLDVGCGSGIYMRRAAQRNALLNAVGIEEQPEVAQLARDNLHHWQLAARTAVENCDVREREAQAEFDLVMLNNNIYYFSLCERVTVLRHLRGFLKIGGKLLVTTACPGGNAASELLNLWGSMSEGAGPLPTPVEMRNLLSAAGFKRIRSRRLVPGYPLFSFIATL